MPLYTYICPCGAERDAFNRVSERHTNAPECHGQMAIKLCPNMGYVQRECHYVCPVTDREVTSYRERKNIMAEHGLVDANDMKPDKGHAKAEAKYTKNAELGALLKQPDLPDKVLDKYKPALPTTI